MMKTKIIASVFSLVFLIAGCGGDGSQKNNEQEKLAETPKQAEPANTKGYGRIKEVKLGTIDAKMAHEGNEIFETKCTACHQLDKRYVGPPLRKVTERRTPEWIMNMILDTELMVEKDDTVKCLLQAYLLKMPNQHVDEKDARNVLEHLRTVATQTPVPETKK